MPNDPPHVFVLHGDLARLACDDVLVPTDLEREVAASWLPLVPDALVGPEGRYGRRVLVDADEDWHRRRRRVLAVPIPESAEGRRQPWLVETTHRGDDADWLLRGVDEFLDVVSSVQVDAPLHGRARRLVGVPLVGTGGGGAAGQRGAVIRDLLPLLTRRAEDTGLDIALVLRNASDHTAAQKVRRDCAPSWPLPEQLQRAAADLARLLWSGDLALFLGSGVSAAAGLPVWNELLDDLATEAGFGPDDREQLRRLSPMDVGVLVARRMGSHRLGEWMASRFAARPYALAHGLLAGLPVRELVTTNYDPLYEIAAEAVGRRPQKLPWQETRAGSPWLLKLHGDAERPGSIVLTREHYVRFADDRTALAGVVQALLLTRHMLFVGFSLVDDNLIRIAHQVRHVLRTEVGDEPRRRGTALAVVDEPVRARLWEEDLDYLPMTEAGTPMPVASRRLEVFLDLLGSLACLPVGYLLDPHYAGMLDPGEHALAEALSGLTAGMSEAATSTPAWQEVEALLQRLGWSGRATAPDEPS